MEAEQALETFLSRALINKKDRYIGFISKPETRKKFLDAIYHELESNLYSSKKVTELLEKELMISGYKFEPPDNFGEPINTLKEIISSDDESFLVESLNGKYAIYGPETFIDSRAYYVV